MYYVWKYNTDDDGHGFFDCGIEQFEGWWDVPWMFGEKIERELPSPLKYFTDSKLMPEDYPMVGSTEFLVSKKIADIIKELNVPNIDYYESVIVRPNGEIIEGYYTVNILNVLDCINFRKSKYKKEKCGPAKLIKFNGRIAFYEKKIPSEIKLFRLEERNTLKIAHQSIVDACERDGVTGIDFIPIEEYSDFERWRGKEKHSEPVKVDSKVNSTEHYFIHGAIVEGTAKQEPHRLMSIIKDMDIDIINAPWNSLMLPISPDKYTNSYSYFVRKRLDEIQDAYKASGGNWTKEQMEKCLQEAVIKIKEAIADERVYIYDVKK